MKSVHYPLLIYPTHYSRYFEHNFVPTPPKNSTTASLGEQYGYFFYSNWTSEKPNNLFTYKRGIIVQLQHANPYYDDYANIGPYGDAITYEFLPFIDKKFRGIGKGWAHDMYGCSTCGWESLAVQVYYPDEYSGCWSFCPDAFDFRRFQQVNLLQNKIAY
ncbi:hypothetical protein PsorP6_010019 [Peronosclerospora sorghi]|uniref:Uncharacterized protein n=1 Tax=Peronosclerospora sorghi TaxID=230839 RepID=A0ACC0VWF1_9STRA|nr:hypothetical protein PsorP6_010019 [Peronosclerospora sorghi]